MNVGDTTKLGPIQRRKLSDEIVERLTAAIRDGTYPAGSFLPSERDLMSLFGVGRPSIREALYALQRIGLVRLVSGERPRVTEPSPKQVLRELDSTVRHWLEHQDAVRHFEQVRLFLETGLVRHACAHATDEQIALLQDALARNEAAIGDETEFALTDVAFHRVIAEIPVNPIFTAMHDAAVEWIIRQRPHLEDAETHNRMSYAGHLAVFQAIRDRDGERAANAMTRHLEEAYNRYARH
jgi:DNA-binding FadR family transcriptional regulator